MSKGLEALKKLKDRANHDEYLSREDTDREKAIKFLNENNSYVSIIEQELKEKDELSHALSIITCENGDLLKYKQALELIKKYQWIINYFVYTLSYKDFVFELKKDLHEEIPTEEEYNFLKEELEK